MSAFQNRRKLWVHRMEQLSKCAPLDFKMARYIQALQIRSLEQLQEALQSNQQVLWVGFGAMNKLRAIAGLSEVKKGHSWKAEATRLYKLLDKHGIDYVKKTPKKRRA